MNSEASNLLADAIEADIQKQMDGNLFEISDDWDELYAQLLPIEDDFGHPTYSIAIRFWECWGDAACHDWRLYPPKEEDWPALAAVVVSALRSGSDITDPFLIEHFKPRPRQGFLKKVFQWFR